jgi:hypothetical protein
MKGVTPGEQSNAKKVTQSTHVYFNFVSYSKISNVKCTFHRANQTGNEGMQVNNKKQFTLERSQGGNRNRKRVWVTCMEGISLHAHRIHSRFRNSNCNIQMPHIPFWNPPFKKAITKSLKFRPKHSVNVCRMPKSEEIATAMPTWRTSPRQSFGSILLLFTA